MELIIKGVLLFVCGVALLYVGGRVVSLAVLTSIAKFKAPAKKEEE